MTMKMKTERILKVDEEGQTPKQIVNKIVQVIKESQQTRRKVRRRVK
jgi:hypothetical protein